MCGAFSGALLLLLAVCTACASASAPAAAGEPRKVTGCRFEAVHYEEVWRCAPNPAEPGRLLCGYRKERMPDRWWLDYERGEPREVDQETCALEGERRRWECLTGDGYVFLNEAPSRCQ